MKYAVYVEGQSEMLFVAYVLREYSNYDPAKCGFLCINLTADDYERINFPKQGDIDSEVYYQIVNVNNDNLVVSKLKKDIPGLIAQGFNVIIGLKDVFGDVYGQLMKQKPEINRERILEMHSAQMDAINAKDCDCRLHFAIMEYEAWMLALIEQYVVSKNKNLDDLCQQLNIDKNAGPETDVYHPYPLVRKIFQACDEDYHKHGKESLSFLSTLTRDDYERLRQSGKCASFSKFLDSLLGGQCPVLP